MEPTGTSAANPSRLTRSSSDRSAPATQHTAKEAPQRPSRHRGTPEFVLARLRRGNRYRYRNGARQHGSKSNALPPDRCSRSRALAAPGPPVRPPSRAGSRRPRPSLSRVFATPFRFVRSGRLRSPLSRRTALHSLAARALHARFASRRQRRIAQAPPALPLRQPLEGKRAALRPPPALPPSGLPPTRSPSPFKESPERGKASPRAAWRLAP